MPIANKMYSLCLCFPVWRELKLSVVIPSQGLAILAILWLSFPVWRELKLVSAKELLECFVWTLDTLSRLKGIETYLFGVIETSLTLYGFVSAFPFEGNWNYFSASSASCHVVIFLWIRFPVWRELKHVVIIVIVTVLQLLWIRFPVWRELKLRQYPQ